MPLKCRYISYLPTKNGELNPNEPVKTSRGVPRPLHNTHAFGLVFIGCVWSTETYSKQISLLSLIESTQEAKLGILFLV